MLHNKKLLLSMIAFLGILSFGFAPSPFSAKTHNVCILGHDAQVDANMVGACHDQKVAEGLAADQAAQSVIKVSQQFADFEALSKAPAGTSVINTQLMVPLVLPEGYTPFYAVTLANGNFLWTVNINAVTGGFITQGYKFLPQ